jgi:hypothetical protein
MRTRFQVYRPRCPLPQVQIQFRFLCGCRLPMCHIDIHALSTRFVEVSSQFHICSPSHRGRDRLRRDQRANLSTDRQLSKKCWPRKVFSRVPVNFHSSQALNLSSKPSTSRSCFKLPEDPQRSLELRCSTCAKWSDCKLDRPPIKLNSSQKHSARSWI